MLSSNHLSHSYFDWQTNRHCTNNTHLNQAVRFNNYSLHNPAHCPLGLNFGQLGVFSFGHPPRGVSLCGCVLALHPVMAVPRRPAPLLLTAPTKPLTRYLQIKLPDPTLPSKPASALFGDNTTWKGVGLHLLTRETNKNNFKNSS